MSKRGRRHSAWLLSAALIAMACGGGEKGAARSDTAATAAPSTAARPDSTATGAAGAAAAPAAPVAITGKTVDVKMVLDGTNYRFDPASVTIHPGDGVRWTMVSGGPHNVSFWADSVPAGAPAVLQANMARTMSPLVGPLLSTANETYVVSFAGAPAGVYKYYCTPHLALGMKAQITVQ